MCISGFPRVQTPVKLTQELICLPNGTKTQEPRRTFRKRTMKNWSYIFKKFSGNHYPRSLFTEGEDAGEIIEFFGYSWINPAKFRTVSIRVIVHDEMNHKAAHTPAYRKHDVTGSSRPPFPPCVNPTRPISAGINAWLRNYCDGRAFRRTVRKLKSNGK